VLSFPKGSGEAGVCNTVVVVSCWLSRDPIGEEGGANLYVNVGNNPVNKVDWFGLQEFPTGGSIGPGVLEPEPGGGNSPGSGGMPSLIPPGPELTVEPIKPEPRRLGTCQFRCRLTGERGEECYYICENTSSASYCQEADAYTEQITGYQGDSENCPFCEKTFMITVTVFREQDWIDTFPPIGGAGVPPPMTQPWPTPNPRGR